MSENEIENVLSVVKLGGMLNVERYFKDKENAARMKWEAIMGKQLSEKDRLINLKLKYKHINDKFD